MFFSLLPQMGDPHKDVKVRDKTTKKTMHITEREHFNHATAMVVNSLRRAGLKTDMYLSVQVRLAFARLTFPKCFHGCVCPLLLPPPLERRNVLPSRRY